MLWLSLELLQTGFMIPVNIPRLHVLRNYKYCGKETTIRSIEYGVDMDELDRTTHCASVNFALPQAHVQKQVE